MQVGSLKPTHFLKCNLWNLHMIIFGQETTFFYDQIHKWRQDL